MAPQVGASTADPIFVATVRWGVFANTTSVTSALVSGTIRSTGQPLRTNGVEGMTSQPLRRSAHAACHAGGDDRGVDLTSKDAVIAAQS